MFNLCVYMCITGMPGTLRGEKRGAGVMDRWLWVEWKLDCLQKLQVLLTVESPSHS